MSKGLWKFTVREIKRIITAARAMGIAEPTLEFRHTADGTVSILLFTGHNQPQHERNEWDGD
jgi:hypothetical protein